MNWKLFCIKRWCTNLEVLCLLPHNLLLHANWTEVVQRVFRCGEPLHATVTQLFIGQQLLRALLAIAGTLVKGLIQLSPLVLQVLQIM